ncbi:hypothetical protein KIL84_004485 [Mauremys mutica]|uniref:Uncharacterized protein n=1 Tax=Mauremys mutica TaxID=74926 RepID=A0A9D3XPH0_9SAUR|nr:hypothetical protein KIL84_004485 [Mauremys mutica]
MAAPRLVPVGVEVGVLLQAEGVAGQLDGTLYFQNEVNTRQKCSGEKLFSLRPENGHMQLLSLKVTPELAGRCGLAALRRGRYVQLVARSPQLPPPGARTLRLAWTSRRGQLFIQTDKPVYTPRQKVHFRVFALNHELRPTAESITITVLNSQGLQVRKVERFPQNWVITDQLSIPDISEPGTWRITARFSNALESNTSAEFEIVPDRTHMLVRGEGAPDLRIDLQVRFVYGKGVNGVAYLRFGVSNEDGEKTFLRGLEQQVTAWGFPTRDIEVSWLRGNTTLPGAEAGPGLPSGDGCYQRQSRLRVPEGEAQGVRCQGRHGDLETPLETAWASRSPLYRGGVSPGTVAGATLGALGGLAGLAGALLLCRRRARWKLGQSRLGLASGRIFHPDTWVPGHPRLDT